MCGSIVDIQSTAAEIRRGKKEEEERRRKKSQGKNIMVCPITQGDHNKRSLLSKGVEASDSRAAVPVASTVTLSAARYRLQAWRAAGNSPSREVTVELEVRDSAATRPPLRATIN